MKITINVYFQSCQLMFCCLIYLLPLTGLSLNNKEKTEKPTEDLIDLLDSLKLGAAPNVKREGGSKTSKNEKNNAVSHMTRKCLFQDL